MTIECVDITWLYVLYTSHSHHYVFQVTPTGLSVGLQNDFENKFLPGLDHIGIRSAIP
jgi:hypothetical protein